MKNAKFAVVAWIFLSIFLLSCVHLKVMLCEATGGSWVRDGEYDGFCSASEPAHQKVVEKDEIEQSSGNKGPSADGFVPEPIPGLAGTWAYDFITEQKTDHLYNITIKWDGKKYSLSDCTYFYQGGSCQINRDDWDGSTFSFILHFPHTGTTTTHTITSVSGDVLSGIRENVDWGTGSIVWRRVY